MSELLTHDCMETLAAPLAGSERNGFFMIYEQVSYVTNLSLTRWSEWKLLANCLIFEAASCDVHIKLIVLI
jgi:hypothetical protein